MSLHCNFVPCANPDFYKNPFSQRPQRLQSRLLFDEVAPLTNFEVQKLLYENLDLRISETRNMERVLYIICDNIYIYISEGMSFSLF